jgi:hypothetical protein
MISLNFIIEQVLLEGVLGDKLKVISKDLETLKNDYDRLRKIYKNDKTKIKSLDNDFIIKRIDMRYDLGDYVKNHRIIRLKDGRPIVSEKDLDDFIQYWKTIKYDNLYLIMSLSFPNPTKHFKGLL